MEFIDRFGGAHKKRLLEAGRIVQVRKGEYLMRQGERGGDIFLVEKGALEVVDSRSVPEVVLSVLRPGTVVGEMAFLDASPRAADVRAATDCTCRLWDHAALGHTLSKEPELAAAFYRVLAETTVDRIRKVQTSAVAGALGPPPRATVRVADEIARQAHQLASSTQHRWMQAEGGLRRNTSDPAAPIEIARAMNDLVRKTRDWMDALASGEERRMAGETLAGEMRPFLLRSALGELALDPPGRKSGDPRLMAHLLLGKARGNGMFGEILDRSLLALPTCDALRARTLAVGLAACELLPQGRPVDIVLLNASTGAILARMVPALSNQGARFTCIDSNREALAFVDAGLTIRPPSVELRLLQEQTANPEDSLASVEPGTADGIVVDGLVDYLPDRLVAGLLGRVSDRLRPGGFVLITGLDAALDAAVFDWLLDWPMVRRRARELRSLVEAAGFTAEVEPQAEGGATAGVVVRGIRSGAGPS